MSLESHQQQQVLDRRLPLATFIDLQQYMGDWYIIAHIPTPFEYQSFNAVESYRWNEKAKRIDVKYHHNVKDPNGPLRLYPHKAWVTDGDTNAEWRVQYFWPLKFTYRILAVAPDYSWAIVGTSKRGFAWIMARKTWLDETVFDSLVQMLEDWDYDISKLRKVPQIWDIG